ncbi:unnamed protein product [Paramecium primaurelia]|uniref:Uncharacterized protein n=1 Tax=Paramecium primaurelia TaxID=5886 RepID=A0A8S1LZ55_PARPR|nr:unnamed protein product [Paramecium primaurelia]
MKTRKGRQLIIQKNQHKLIRNILKENKNMALPLLYIQARTNFKKCSSIQYPQSDGIS